MAEVYNKTLNIVKNNEEQNIGLFVGEASDSPALELDDAEYSGNAVLYTESTDVSDSQNLKIFEDEGYLPLFTDSSDVQETSSDPCFVVRDGETEVFAHIYNSSDLSFLTLSVDGNTYAIDKTAKPDPKPKFADENKIYGFKIDKNDSNPATRVTYTDDAVGFTPTTLNSDGTLNLGSWTNRFVIKAFRPVMLNYDGTVAYELDHDDQTKKLDGTASDISNTSFGGNAMVGASRLWFYCYDDGNYEYCKVAAYQVNANYKAYAHIDANGNLKEEIYLPMFEGSYISSKMRSLAGQSPGVSQNGTTEITYAQANGTGWYTDDWINHKLIENLAILISRSTNSQTSFGRGFVDGNSAPCQTGTLKNKGMFYGPSGGKSAVKLFYIENYYGSRWDRIAGCVTKSDYKVWVKPNPPYNTDGTGYTAISTLFTSGNSGYTNKCTMTEYGLVPTQIGGSETTYYADYFFLYSGASYGWYGGYWGDGGGCGLGYLYLYNAVSFSNGDLGASLSYK